MKKIQVENSIICQNNDSVFNYYGWASVARLPDGTLAMTASGHRLAHVCPFGKAIMCYSRDEGRTWSEPSIIIDSPLDDRDAGIAVFGNGDVIVTSFNNTAAMQREYANHRTTDDMYLPLIGSYLDIIEKNAAEAVETEKTEKKYLGSTYRISKDGGYTFGDFKRAPVTAPHGPAVMRDGTLLYIGNKCDGKTHASIECHKLNENGEFEYLSSIESAPDTENRPCHNCEPHAIVMPDGKIIAHIRMDEIFTTYQSESHDGGKTFTKPHSIGLKHGSPPHLMLHSGGVLISAYGCRSEPFGQRVMFSKDGGETWDTDYILRDDGNNGDLGYPCTVELKNGSLLTVYYQAEKGRNNCVIMQSIWRLPKI